MINRRRRRRRFDLELPGSRLERSACSLRKWPSSLGSPFSLLDVVSDGVPFLIRTT